jgi:hypothetical protein
MLYQCSNPKICSTTIVSLSSLVSEERRENMARMEDDETDLLEKLRFASGL